MARPAWRLSTSQAAPGARSVRVTEPPDVVLREVRDDDLDLLYAFRTDSDATRMVAASAVDHGPRLCAVAKSSASAAISRDGASGVHTGQVFCQTATEMP